MPRIKIEVEVNTDPVPGWGHDPEDYVKLIQRHLDDTIPHYNPVVTLSENQMDTRENRIKSAQKLKEEGCSNSEIARRMGLPENHIRELLTV